MVGSGSSRGLVTCPACGDEIERREAREYDKDGERWERRGKRVEYLCRPCHDGLGEEDRDGLEATLVEINAGTCDRGTFLRRFSQAMESRHGTADEH